MNRLSARQHYKLLLQIVLGLMPFVILGFILIAIFRWGEIMPYFLSLFTSQKMSILEVTLLGVITGTVTLLATITLITVTKTEFPPTKGGDILRNILQTPSGIAVTAVCGGLFEEFFFRGVLIGLFVGHSYWIDGIVILISTFLFWIIHIPQYKGVYVAYGLVFINGLLFALLFYFTNSLIPSILTHAIYNLGIGIYFMRKYTNPHRNSQADGGQQ